MNAELDFLLTVNGQSLIAEGMSSYDDSDALTHALRLRSLGGYSAEQVSAAVTQVTLRHQAATKFGSDAAAMYFTRPGLEQATHPAVAAHRAARARATGAGSSLDLGCGIGSDLVAFARAGFTVTGVDSDPDTAEVATANLAALGLSGSVTVAAAESVDLEPFDLVFADPSRRRGTTRVFDPRAFSPPWDFVLALLTPRTTTSGRPQRVILKLAPGLDHRLIPPEVEAEWVSLDGELKEVALWCPAPGAARRRATLLGTNREATSITDEGAPLAAADVREVGAYIYEPDSAVVRAHLVSVVARDLDGWLLDPHIAYVSCDREVPTALAKGFRVVDVLPFKEKALRAALRARNIGAITIKKRGVSVTPETLRRKLALRGDRAATVILTRTPRSATAVLVEPLD